MTQAPQYDHFNQNRFILSNEAISSINVLQSTEWAVNLDMADLPKETIKKHVKDEILDKFKIRKAYEIRRHYFQNVEGTRSYLLMATQRCRESERNLLIVSKLRIIFQAKTQALKHVHKRRKQDEARPLERAIHEVLYIDFDGVKPR